MTHEEALKVSLLINEARLASMAKRAEWNGDMLDMVTDMLKEVMAVAPDGFEFSDAIKRRREELAND